jgi:hypothetical protein
MDTQSTFNPRGGKCESCGKNRSLKDGLCHECEQSEIDAERCAICGETTGCHCDGGPYIPGGYRL